MVAVPARTSLRVWVGISKAGLLVCCLSARRWQHARSRDFL